MTKLQAFLNIGLVGTIVALELLGLTHGNTDPRSNGAAIAAPIKTSKRPYRRASGAKRGVCRQTLTQPAEELMAFLPQKSVGEAAGPDLSATKAPIFYFYVPDEPSNVANLEFRLDYASGDRRGSGVLQPPLNIPIGKTPGVVKVQLPEVLEPNTTYEWSFILRCRSSREIVAFKGSVVYQALDASIADEIARTVSAEQKAAIYTQNGFLLDAMPILMAEGTEPAKTFAEIIAITGLEKPIEPSPKADPK
jgi:Domain of Unknown Function (DUF928)